jgi:hypothetical protein|tara:strand:+ start:1638 stop:2246 length:609 start_codon:yes stop_codon:yes gene_type:complete
LGDKKMPIWGATDSDESKPKHLTTAQKKEVFANASGWVVEAGSTQSGNSNTSADPEVLVAIGSLATSLGSADITEIDWITTAADKSDGFSLSVRAFFNEPVDVVTSGGVPYLAVTNGNEGSGSGRGPHNLPYASGTGTNELVFTLAIAADNAATNASDVLVIAANAIALNSGTIKDAGLSTNSTITSSSAIGTAAGSITVSA